MTTPDGKSYYDIHVATPNGVSNHLLIEARRPTDPRPEPEGWWAIACPDPRPVKSGLR